jgi:hypothetical protein
VGLWTAQAIRSPAGWKEAEELSTCSHWDSEAAKLDCSRRLSSSTPPRLPMQRPGPRCTSSSHSGSGGVGRGDGKAWGGMGRHGRRPLRPHQREATPEMHPCETEHERTPAELSNHQVHPGGKRHHLQIAARLLLWFGHCLAAILHVRPEVPSTREI